MYGGYPLGFNLPYGLTVTDVVDGDTRDSLATRILVSEHRLLLEVLRWLSEDRVTVMPANPGVRPRVRVDGIVPCFGFAEEP